VRAGLQTGSAPAAPTLDLQPSCAKDPTGETVYGVIISLTGLAPNASFTGRLDYTYIDPPPGQVGGSVGPATFTADANGNFTFGPFGTVGVKTIFTATVEYQGQTLTQTLRVTCEPTTKAECKNDGWRDFGEFKNQGDCVRFGVHQAIKACITERAAIGRDPFRQKYGIGRFDLFAFLSCVKQGVDG
jgi:hypothetical protein